MEKPVQPLDAFGTFGDLLRYLRRKARLTQTELSIAVGYSVSQISRLESNQRAVDRASLFSLFVPALHLEEQADAARRLLELSEAAAGDRKGNENRPPPAANLPPRYSAARSKPGSLPVELTSFIGREQAVTQVCQMLVPTEPNARGNAARLLTLTGAGGSGKTRLALRVASLLAPSYAEGVRLVELAPLSDPDRVLPAAVSAIGLFTEAGKSPLADLIDFLSSWRGLIVLDNCEHLVTAAARLVGALLVNCPNVQILATSREPLRVPGEVTYRVPLLSVPPGDFSRKSPGFEAENYEASRLFVERARAADPDFHLSSADLLPLARICRQLNGIPLAIELAAARVNVLSVRQIADRLEKDSQLLTSPHREPVLRHQTLQAAIDWSYALLSAAEKRLFWRLSIFSGGCSLEAAEQICAFENEQGLEGTGGIIDLLAALIDKSLITTRQVRGAPEIGVRYEFQEVVRQYALEKLEQSGQVSAIRDRHLRYYLDYAVSGWRGYRNGGRIEWHYRLGADHYNLLSAADWAYLNPGQAEMGARIAVAVQSVFWADGQHHELAALLRRGLEFSLPALVRARVLNALADVSTDDFTRRKCYRESEQICRSLGDAAIPELAGALCGLAGMLVNQVDSNDVTLDRLNESIALLRRRGMEYRWELASCLFVRSYFLSHQMKANEEQAYQDAVESIAIHREIGDYWQANEGLWTLGCIYVFQGEIERAGQSFAEAFTLSVEEEDVVGTAIGSFYLSWVAYLQGNYQGALLYNCDSFELTHRIIRKPVFAGGNVAAASVYLVSQSLQLPSTERAAPLWRAAVLRRAAACLYPQDLHYITDALEADLVRVDETFRRELPAEELSAAYEEGQSLTQEQVYWMMMELGLASG